MAENIPPAPAVANRTAAPVTGATNAEQAPNRGLPYYEKLRRELRDTLQKKRIMDKNMAALEESIYRFEQSYLEETGAGNIIKGFDNYIKGASSTSGLGSSSALGSLTGSSTGGPMTRRKGQVSDMDRVFSRSSASFMRDSPAPSSAHTTPSHAPTPASSGPTANKDKDKDSGGNSSTAGNVKGAANKKSKKSTASARDDDEDADSGPKQPAKRLKITYARE